MLTFFLLMPLFLLVSGYTNAKETDISRKSQACLDCHNKPGIFKTFENNETIEVYINAKKFRESVHNFLACSDCHTDFYANNHPKERFRSKDQFKIKSSLACRKCHILEKIKTIPVHSELLKEEKEGRPLICTNCHGSHSITHTAVKKTFEEMEQFCLNCHKHNLKLSFKNMESIYIRTNLKDIQSSVHNKLNCADCHFGFSFEEHPKRKFKNKRSYTIAVSESCRRCHFDKYTKILESIHYIMLSKGNLNAPVCTDCHGSHTIVHVGKEKMLIAKRCQKCHSQIYDIYAKSVHGKSLFDENNQDVPVCTDCHKAHDIKNPLTKEYHERIPEMCGNCHANKAVVGKYGLSTDVVKTYLSDFHGITLEFYKKQSEPMNKPARAIAVCTDCHGIHNINSVIGSDSAIIKTNIAKRCKNCHHNSKKNFPDTWLSHFKPSLTKFPIVFIVSMIYEIFIPFMIIGLILQILLHVWRYAVTR